jgi:hypothetical protein
MELRKFLGLAFGALILLGLFGAGIELLRESIAQGESIVWPILLLAIPLLVAGGLLAFVLQLLIRPLKRHANVSNVIAIAIAAVLGLGIYTANSGVPLQRPDAAVTAAVAPACAGTAVEAAGRVTTGSAALNHIVVLDSAGVEFGWTGKPSVDWRPPTVGDVELVACVQPEDAEVAIEVCRYNGPSTTRYSATREVRVVAAHSGVELARFSITSQPSSCPAVKAEDLSTIKASVDWWEVEDHLESLVKTGAFVDPDANEDAEPWESSGPARSPEPAWTTEPTVEVREVSLAKAISEGLVTVKAVSDSLQSLDLEITSTAAEDLSVNIPAGTYFVPKRAATQTMVVISAAWVEVPAADVVDAVLDVACAQMHDDQPGETGKADTFTVRTTAAKGDLAKLLKADAFAVADFRIQQFAVWTITSNPSKSGYVRLGTSGVGSGPSAAELRAIKSMFTAAGISTGQYRALP